MTDQLTEALAAVLTPRLAAWFALDVINADGDERNWTFLSDEELAEAVSDAAAQAIAERLTLVAWAFQEFGRTELRLGPHGPDWKPVYTLNLGEKP